MHVGNQHGKIRARRGVGMGIGGCIIFFVKKTREDTDVSGRG
jgi:hypothetical protein